MPLPQGVEGTTLGRLRSELSAMTGFSAFKILYSGGVMVDDRLPLSAYGIKPRSVLALVGSGRGADEVGKVERELKSAKGRKKGAEEATEARTVESIKAKVLELKDALGARMGQFKNSVRLLFGPFAPWPPAPAC